MKNLIKEVFRENYIKLEIRDTIVVIKFTLDSTQFMFFLFFLILIDMYLLDSIIYILATQSKYQITKTVFFI